MTWSNDWWSSAAVIAAVVPGQGTDHYSKLDVVSRTVRYIVSFGRLERVRALIRKSVTPAVYAPAETAPAITNPI